MQILFYGRTEVNCKKLWNKKAGAGAISGRAGFRAIGIFLKTSHVSVYKWIKSFGKIVDNFKSDKEIKIVVGWIVFL